MLRYLSVMGIILATVGGITIVISVDQFWRGCIVYGVGALTMVVVEWMDD